MDDPFWQDIKRISSISEVPLILEACRAATGMGFTAVARVTEDRWITCSSLDHLNFGLKPGEELEVSSTICHEVRNCRDTIVIPDVDASEAYRNHHTPRRYGFKSYISVPIIRKDGSFWGTLCAIDPEPRSLGLQVAATFRLFAQILAHELDREEELESGRAALASERDTARLREEFIAVVGHDLRNPIAAVSAGLSLLSKRPSEERMATLVPEMQRAISRADQIIANLLDFARGRLGAGLELLAPGPVPLEPVLRGIIGEIEQIAAQPIKVVLNLPHPIRADPQRLGQLLSNLLGNAVVHGATNEPIRVEAVDRGGQLRLLVNNRGAPIPEELLASLFLPFSRYNEQTSLQGLGLGLYIASQIAQAHGGRIDVKSNELDGTTFEFTMLARYD
jgi:signal transduction histidine kinase